MTLRQMFGAGLGALRRYRGVVLGVYLVQAVIALLTAAVMAMSLSGSFGQRPLFDRAVDGDAAALAAILVAQPGAMSALMWPAALAVLLYAVSSWFLHGELLAAFLDPRPLTRGEAARRFGAGGAATFFRFGAINLWSVLLYLPVLVAFAIGLGGARDAMRDAMTWGDAIAALIPRAVPGLVLLLVARTITDYARVRVARTPGLAAWRALLGASSFVVRHPRALAHVALAWLLAGAIAIVYVAGTWNAPLAGAGGALLLLLLRQGTLGARFVIRAATIASQGALAVDACPAEGTPRHAPARAAVSAPTTTADSAFE